MSEGIQHMNDREYAKSYTSDGIKVKAKVLIADDEKRQIVM